MLTLESLYSKKIEKSLLNCTFFTFKSTVNYHGGLRFAPPCVQYSKWQPLLFSSAFAYDALGRGRKMTYIGILVVT